GEPGCILLRSRDHPGPARRLQRPRPHARRTSARPARQPRTPRPAAPAPAADHAPALPWCPAQPALPAVKARAVRRAPDATTKPSRPPEEGRPRLSPGLRDFRAADRICAPDTLHYIPSRGLSARVTCVPVGAKVTTTGSSSQVTLRVLTGVR